MYKLIVGIGSLVVLLIILLYFFVLVPKDDDEDVQDASSTTQQPTLLEQSIQQCLQEQQRDACLFEICPQLRGHSYLCAEDLLRLITKISGPEEGISVLHDIMESRLFMIPGDGHPLSHIVGRATSTYYGINREAFERCPTDFQWGCQHGILERALEKESDPVKAAIGICGESGSLCYHGVGHGFVFHTSYNLLHALSLCDEIPVSMHASCWNGVFMENLIGFFDHTVEGETGFLEDDILAPCSRVEDKYRSHCWVYHGRYLLYHNRKDDGERSLPDTAQFCLTTGKHVRGCMESLVHYIVIPSYQGALIGSFRGTYAETVIYLCNQFPFNWVTQCQSMAIKRIVAINKTENSADITRVSQFCLLLNDVRDCFKRVGTKLRGILSNKNEILRSCKMAPEEYREDCYRSAGINQETIDVLMQDISMLPDTEEQTNTPTQKLRQCLDLPTFQDSCYFALCGEEGSYLCAEDILDIIVKIEGPEEAMEVLDGIMESSLFAIQKDGHQLAHAIGRSTSRHFGLSGESFLRCPADLNYGCQHGFFEDALIQHTIPVKAAIEICESVPERPYKNKFYCYHGVGHGFMFHESYHLINSLNLCDLLPSFMAQEGCWQGVFMENINGYFDNAEGEMGFIEDDVLAPCNRINNKYRHQCYENHSAYILKHYNNSIKDASHACLEARERIPSCINSLGLMTTNPGWQQSLRGSFNGTFTEIAVHLCMQFPSDYIEECKLAAIANLFNFDNTDIRRSTDICLFFEGNKDNCFKTIGSMLVNVAASEVDIMQSCDTVPEEYIDSCYEGAGIDVT